MALSDQQVALAYRALYLGDLLTAVPALRSLRRALPGHRIVLATHGELDPLVRLIDAVDRLWPVQELQPLHWAGPPVDVAVNMHGRGPESHGVVAAVEPERLVAFRHPDAGVDGPVWQPGEHEVRRWCRLVRESFTVAAPCDDVTLPRPARRPAVCGAIVLHPGASVRARRWPAERFADVARYLARTGRPVVVTGLTAERPLAERVCELAGLPNSCSLAGATGLDELAALVAHARLVVSNDTGVAHLATAFRRPSVVLFGPMSPAEWGPVGDGPHVALWRGRPGPIADHGGGGRTDPRRDGCHAPDVDPALDRIQVDDVLRAAESLLRGAPTAA